MIERWAVIRGDEAVAIYKREEVARVFAEKFFGSARVARLVEEREGHKSGGDSEKFAGALIAIRDAHAEAFDYKDALIDIAAGIANPERVAKEALAKYESLKPWTCSAGHPVPPGRLSCPTCGSGYEQIPSPPSERTTEP